MSSQGHLDRLSAIDAAFLDQERPATHMHIGGVALFEGPPPSWRELADHISGRLHLVPRYRQKLAVPPLDTGRPLWIDDPNFNLGYHVRHAALPAPGDDEQLRRLVARTFSQRLDRSKPLWEMLLVEGLADKRFALISKTHHALVDGIAGVDLTTVLFDLEREPGREASAAGRAEGPPSWYPRPEPSSASLAAAGLEGAARASGEIVRGVLGAAVRPRAALGAIREVAQGIGEVAWAAVNAPPDTPFNVAPGPHRRVAFVRGKLSDYKEIKDALGGTVNDVVLTVVAGALAEYLKQHGWRTQGLELRAAVPVSVRTAEQRGGTGNQLTQILAPLPVFIDDPVARLRYVRAAMDGLKESRQALGAKTIASAQGFAPPTLLAQASRLNFSDRFYNLLVTNVPGPQFPLYMLGRKLDALYPVPFLAGNRSLAVAVMSYDGLMAFGLIGDFDALDDLDSIADGLRDAHAELLGLARRQARGVTGRPPRTRASAARGRAKR